MGDRYHPIYEAVWADIKFRRFPDPWLSRAFFVYLCSHERTAPAGIYAVTPEVLAAETCRPLKWVQETLARASTEGLIRVHDGVLWVVKYLARQPNRKGEAYQRGVVAALKRLGLSHPLCQEFLDTYKTLGRPLADPRLRVGRASTEPPPHPPSGILHPASSIRHPPDLSEGETPLPPIGGLNGFSEFWARYPKQEGKGKAEESWQRHVTRRKVSTPDVLTGITKWEGSQKWAEGFIPLPATWLNQHRWEDTPTPASSRKLTAQQVFDQAKRMEEEQRG